MLSQIPVQPTLPPDPHPAPLFCGSFQTLPSGLRRKHFGTSFESLPILHRMKGELINARHAQRVGEGGLGVGGRARSTAELRAVREARDLEARTCGPLLAGGDRRWLGQGARRCPQGVPALILGNSDLPPTGPPLPTHRVLQNSHSFRPELISSLPAA